MKHKIIYGPPPTTVGQKQIIIHETLPIEADLPEPPTSEAAKARGLRRIARRHYHPETARTTVAPVEQSGWLPIESAPRDGTRILVWLPESENVLSVYWDEQFTFRFDEEKGKSVDYQGEYEGAWTDDAVKSWAYQEKESYNPTYWKPVPAPPVTIP